MKLLIYTMIYVIIYTSMYEATDVTSVTAGYYIHTGGVSVYYKRVFDQVL
jgi:hypothetical protein